MYSIDLALGFGLSSWEWLVILLVALLLFGRRLPDIMRGLGSSVKEFKKGMDDSPAAPPPPPPAAPGGSVPRDPQHAATPPADAPPTQPPKA